MKRGFLDVQSPVFRPLWLRGAITALCVVWALIELSRGAVFWAVLFGAAGAYLFYQFFIVFDPQDPEDQP